MKRFYSTFIFFLLFSCFTIAQTTFRLSYDIASFDLAAGMVESPLNTGYTMAGTNASFIPLYGNVVHFDTVGTIQWAKSYTGGVSTEFSDIKNVSSGGYIVCGSSSTGGAVLLRLDNLGNITWAKRYQCPDKSGKPSNEAAYAVIETSDGGFAVAGGVDYFWDGVSATTIDTTSALGFKVDPNGTLQWSRI